MDDEHTVRTRGAWAVSVPASQERHKPSVFDHQVFDHPAMLLSSGKRRITRKIPQATPPHTPPHVTPTPHPTHHLHPFHTTHHIIQTSHVLTHQTQRRQHDTTRHHTTPHHRRFVFSYQARGVKGPRSNLLSTRPRSNFFTCKKWDGVIIILE